MAESKGSTDAKQREAEIARLRTKISVIRETHAILTGTFQSVNELIRLAEGGDELPVRFLEMIAVLSIEALNSIVEQRPKLGRRLARDRFVWPALISRKKSLREANEELMDKLKLGKGGIFSGREWQPTANSTQAALRLFILGQSRALQGLGRPFTVKTKKDWFQENWAAMLKAGIEPEKSNLLGPLGKSKFKKHPKYCKNLHPATQIANARDEIRHRVWKAFDKLFAP